ncbi:MAG TPA: FtsW/RodA/SpoVE family cell cycle protein [Patescibacteria group bacterium]|nr:FtsW/RodA/SpoVE family cell cycle protein [Patescibacteria group bacterium]
MKKKFDFVILFCLISLSAFSFFTILGSKNSFLRSQLLYFFMGFLSLFIFYRIGIRFFRLNTLFFYCLSVGLLIFGFFFGESIRGSRRWIDLYFFNFQPSEFLKTFFIIYIAHFFSVSLVKTEAIIKNMKKIMISFLIFIPPIFIVFMQPDLGSSIVYLLIYVSIIFFSRFPPKYFLYSAIFFLSVTPLVWHFLAEYQKNRIVSFIEPSADPDGISYNLIQSIITIGSGGFFGRGLGQGTQSRFLFLPENATDFAYASLVEQFGFIGGIIVIVLYGIIAYRLIQKIQRSQKGSFNFLFLTSSLIYLIAHVSINIGMNLGLLPIAGIPLLLISYGGSSIVSTMMLFGLAMSL